MTTLAPPGTVVLVDDDPVVRAATTQMLELAGLTVRPFDRARAVAAMLDREFNGVIVSDIRMPEIDGLQLFRMVRAIDPSIPFILITGHGDIPMAVAALQNGADDFIPKPFASAHFIASVQRALSRRQLELDNRLLRGLIGQAASASSALVGETPAMVRLRGAIEQVAAADVDILIEGEAGVGKKLLALMLHRASPRRTHPFVSVLCGALTASAGGEQLFGDAGAGGKPGTGQIESANRGTLFLDSIDQLDGALQQRLLRVVEDRVIVREGARQPLPIDIRIVAAARSSGADAGGPIGLRADLFHALNVVRFRIPPLRERRADIPLLFAHFVDEAATQLRRRPAALTDAARRHLLDHDWPGNVRELRSFAFRSAVGVEAIESEGSAAETPPLPDRVDRFEASVIRAVLGDVEGNAAEAVRRLGIPRKTFYDKLNRHGIVIADFRRRDAG